VLELTPKALAVLEYLMTHPDEAVTRERLLDAVWGWEYPAGTRTVDTRMAELRRALNDDPSEPRYIETRLSFCRRCAWRGVSSNVAPK
jgi:DNA-binding response OmpR family regulator